MTESLPCFICVWSPPKGAFFFGLPFRLFFETVICVVSGCNRCTSLGRAQRTLARLCGMSPGSGTILVANRHERSLLIFPLPFCPSRRPTNHPTTPPPPHNKKPTSHIRVPYGFWCTDRARGPSPRPEHEQDLMNCSESLRVANFCFSLKNSAIEEAPSPRVFCPIFYGYLHSTPPGFHRNPQAGLERLIFLFC